MKKILVLLAFIASSSAFAASVTVNEFEFDFYLEKDAYEVDFDLEMACRWEKFVISDSSEYEYIYKNVPLKITKMNAGSNLTKVTVKNVQKRKLNLSGMFKYGKECQTYLKFFFKSKKYSIGWANQFDRPIRLGVFEHSRLAEYKVFDANAIIDMFDNKEVSFIYKPVTSQINVRLGFDGEPTRGMSSYLFMSVAKDRRTGKPYKLK